VRPIGPAGHSRLIPVAGPGASLPADEDALDQAGDRRRQTLAGRVGAGHN
jgi:hypothetical protein